MIRVHSRRQWSFLRRFFVKCCFAALEFRGPAAQPRRANALRSHTRPDRLRPLRAERPAMPAASSDDARGASSAASVLAPSEGETEDPRTNHAAFLTPSLRHGSFAASIAPGPPRGPRAVARAAPLLLALLYVHAAAPLPYRIRCLRARSLACIHVWFRCSCRCCCLTGARI